MITSTIFKPHDFPIAGYDLPKWTGGLSIHVLDPKVSPVKTNTRPFVSLPAQAGWGSLLSYDSTGTWGPAHVWGDLGQ